MVSAANVWQMRQWAPYDGKDQAAMKREMKERASEASLETQIGFGLRFLLCLAVWSRAMSNGLHSSISFLLMRSNLCRPLAEHTPQ